MRSLFQTLFAATLMLSLCFGAGEALAQCSDELIDQCNKDLKNYTFVRTFPVRMKKSRKGNPQEAYFTISLTKDNTYKFQNCVDTNSTGQMIVSLFDQSGLITSTYDKGSDFNYSGIIYECHHSGQYFVSIKFTDNLENCGVSMLSFTSTLELKKKNRYGSQ